MRKCSTSSLLLSMIHVDRCSCSEVWTRYAVLDLRFSPQDGDKFAIATSTGAIDLFFLDLADGARMRKIRTFQISEQSILALSLAWGPSSGDKSSIAMSLSDGKVGVLSYWPLRHNLSFVQAHALEAWTVEWSFSAETDSIVNVYSGGDDSMICRHEAWHRRQQQQFDSEGLAAQNVNKKLHTAGVTAILPIPFRQGAIEILITGCYDEYVRVIAVDPSKNSWKILTEEHLHGGVWALKALSWMTGREDGTVAYGILASCMHAGARVLEIRRSSNQEWSVTVLAKFVEHESMNYASDARRILPNEGAHHSLIVVSTSFYDNRLCVWRINDDLRADQLGH